MRYLLAGLCYAVVGLGASAVAADPAEAGKFITLDVVIADLPEAGGAAPTPAAILEMEKAKKLTSCMRLKLTALENMQSMVQFGEQAALVSGRSQRGGERAGFGPGGLQSAAVYRTADVGTIVQATARVEADGGLVVQLNVERSRVAAAPAEGEGAAANPDVPQGTTRVSFQSTVRAKSGEPVIVGGRQYASGKEATQTWIVLTASVAAGGAPGAAPAAAAPANKAAQAAPPGQEIKVFQLKHASAADLAGVLADVFGPHQIRFTADARTNSLLVLGPSERIALAEPLVIRLDEAR